MPNLDQLLKSEISRLARKAMRDDIGVLKRTVSGLRTELSGLRTKLSALEKQAARNASTARHLRSSSGSSATAEALDNLRFSAKGLASHRSRLGLSAEELGRLVGVSSQSVYGWESGKTKPRRAQLEALAGVRRMGKKSARRALEALAQEKSGQE